LSVTVCDAKPSIGRKFLMAGKSGLNLTKVQSAADFLAAYGDAAPQLRAALAAFGPDQVQGWARALGQPVFTGSSGRVFPVAMKGSPLLRAWLAQLTAQDVTFSPRWRWTGWGDGLTFDTPDGAQVLHPDVTVLACGGASWARLGSDGAWAEWVGPVAPFAASNVGLHVDWSAHMTPHLGQPLKAVTLRAGGNASRGEAMISARGLEGGGLYPLAPALRAGAALTIDMAPDLTADALRARLARARPGDSAANRLRKAGLDPAKVALVLECARPLPADLAALVKALPVPHLGLRPMDEAISTAGGLRFDALDAGLMLRDRPGVFAAGEMLDWDAPTGGYLLTACMATGLWAGRHAAAFANSAAQNRLPPD
jgi:uncharacterized flavoprotein (TIGR03862 family)